MILEINSLPAMGPRGSYVRAAQEAGLDFDALVARLVEVASARYFGTPTPPTVSGSADDPKQRVFTFLTERRDRLERRVRDWTRRPSATDDPVGPLQAARVLGRSLDEAGMRRVDDFSDDQNVFTWETAAGVTGGTLLVVHLDVPPSQSVAAQAFRREPEWLFGDGIGSSKAPLASLEFALRALRHARVLRMGEGR